MENSTLRLMCVLAHPDDESLGLGGTLAKYASLGVETYVVTATRGERGRFGDADPRPAPEVVGKAREAELLAAAAVLGVKEVSFLDYLDADLDRAPVGEVTNRIAAHLRRIRPQVVITFGQDGGYGHPDHIAISQFTLAAIVKAASGESNGPPGGANGIANLPPHSVSKLYHIAWDEPIWSAYQSAFKKLTSTVDGVERQAVPIPGWLVTTMIDAGAHWEAVWRAVQCHQTQISVYAGLSKLTPEQHRVIWGRQSFYRVFSTVNGGRTRETDLFEGLR